MRKPWPVVVAFVAVYGTVVAASPSWAGTVYKSRRQQTLSQRLAAKALMIIQGIEPLTHRQGLAHGMGRFDATLLQLMTGSQEVMAPPETAAEVLQEVSAAWQSLNSTLTALLADNETMVPALAAESLEVYNKLDKLTEIYVSAGIANSGSWSSDARIDLLQRQEGLVYKMWKETLLTSQGMPQAAANLLESKALFQSTHRGIMDGAEWLDIPKLSEVCALRAMTDVTYYFDQLSQLLVPISSADPAQQRDTAANLALNISNISASLSSAMGNALESFLSSSCDTAQPTELEWLNVLNTAEDQLLQASQATQLFLQIALEYKVAESKVQLTLLSDDATVSLRNLLEGNKAAGLVAPPTQELSDQVTSVKEVWAAMRIQFTKAVFSDSIPIPTVSDIVRLTKLFTEQMEAVISLIVRTSAETTLPSHTINLASSQRTRAQKIAKQATIINLGYSIQENSVEFHATTDLLVDTHWILLEGAPPAAPYPAVNATSNLCIIQQMWRAFDVYESLEIAAEAVLQGERSLSQLETYVSKFDREMGVAVEWYKSTGGIGVLCDPFNLSLEYWKGLIDEVGRFRSLSQELSSAFLLVSLNMSTADAVTEGRRALDASAKRLRFGSKLVPPPPVQYLLDKIMANLLPAVDRYHLAFEQDDVPTIFSQSSALLQEADAFLQSYFAEAKAAAVEAPLYRMDMASRQVALAQSIFSDYVRGLLENSTVVGQLSNSIDAFEGVHQILRHGGQGIEPLSLVRQDALKHWERIGESFSAFKAQLRTDAVGKVREALGALVADLEEGVRLFGIPDEEMRGEPLWPIIAYSSMVLCMCVCGCAAIYAVRRRYAERAEWHLEHIEATHKV